jgi:predicted nucleic acid-binding protein
LDTSVVIARADAVPSSLPDEAAISIVTLAELHYGVLVAKDEEVRQYRLRRLGVIEATFQPISIDAAVARAFATVSNAVRLAGRQPRGRRTMDLWIAATALAHGLSVYTHNPDDFVGLENLIEVRPIVP